MCFCWFIAWWPLVVVKVLIFFSLLWALVGGVELFVNWMRNHAPQPLIYQLIQADAKLVCENWRTNDKCQTSRRKEREREREHQKKREKERRKDIERKSPKKKGYQIILFYLGIIFQVPLVTPIEKAAKERKVNSKEQRKQEHAKDKKAEKEERPESSKSKKQQKHAKTEKNMAKAIRQ